MRKQANNLKKGNFFIAEGYDEPFEVLDNQHSKSGKHGAAKCRITCVGLFTGKKKSLTMKADDTVEIPEINKRSGQLININEAEKVMQVMDKETFETLDVDFPLDPEDEVNYKKIEKLLADPNLWNETTIEFWDVMNKKFVTRIILPDL